MKLFALIAAITFSLWAVNASPRSFHVSLNSLKKSDGVFLFFNPAVLYQPETCYKGPISQVLLKLWCHINAFIFMYKYSSAKYDEEHKALWICLIFVITLVSFTISKCNPVHGNQRCLSTNWHFNNASCPWAEVSYKTPARNEALHKTPQQEDATHICYPGHKGNIFCFTASPSSCPLIWFESTFQSSLCKAHWWSSHLSSSSWLCYTSRFPVISQHMNY